MIKCFGFGKLLKQLFIISLISCFGLLGSSFVNAGYLRDIGYYGYSPYDQAFNVNIISKGTFLTEKLGFTKDIFYVKGDGNERAFMFWDVNGLPYFYVSQLGQNDRYHRSSITQGEIIDYLVCDKLQDIEGYTPQNCTVQSVGVDTVNIFSSFLSKVKSTDLFYFDLYNYYNDVTTSTILTVCISSDDVGNSLCFVGCTCVGDQRFCHSSVGLQGNNLYNFDNSNISFDMIDRSILYRSPGLYFDDEGGVDLGPGGIELSSDESAINYYEKTYGRTKDICYVGVDNYTDLRGTPVSFEQGSGLSIFQVFSGLYGNTDLDRVYVWLNSRLINYEQWYGVGGGYGTVGEPHFLATYNSGTNRVDLYSSGMSFPFANNPVAFYFMTDYITMYSPYPSMGSSVVSYCNLKILSGSFEEILDEADKNNIDGYTEQSNTNKGLNSDGTEVKRNFPGGSDYGTGDRVVLTGNVGSWTDMTWEDMQYSGDVSLKDFFENAIDEMKSAMDNNIDSPFTGVLPQYIISAFLFVCLFRLLRK